MEQFRLLVYISAWVDGSWLLCRALRRPQFFLPLIIWVDVNDRRIPNIIPLRDDDPVEVMSPYQPSKYDSWRTQTVFKVVGLNTKTLNVCKFKKQPNNWHTAHPPPTPRENKPTDVVKILHIRLWTFIFGVKSDPEQNGFWNRPPVVFGWTATCGPFFKKRGPRVGFWLW